MTILGIDPGLGRMGWACVERTGSRLALLDCGLIETPSIPLPDRLSLIDEAIRNLFSKYRPDCLATERLVFAANRTTALDVSKSLGVVLLASSKAQVAWTEYAPNEIKQAVCGYGAADKKQVSFMACKLVGLREAPKVDDVADALAIAITHGLRSPSITNLLGTP